MAASAREKSRENSGLGAAATAGYARLLGFVNENDDRSFRASRVEIDLVDRLDVTAFSRVNFDIGFRRKSSQFVDQLFDFHRPSFRTAFRVVQSDHGAAHAPSQTSPVCAPDLRPRAVGRRKPGTCTAKKTGPLLAKNQGKSIFPWYRYSCQLLQCYGFPARQRTLV